jgi:hypothetical protein
MQCLGSRCKIGAREDFRAHAGMIQHMHMCAYVVVNAMAMTWFFAFPRHRVFEYDRKQTCVLHDIKIVVHARLYQDKPCNVSNVSNVSDVSDVSDVYKQG